jgi:surface polysaccharide O-acyltransferase-like enzyme
MTATPRRFDFDWLRVLLTLLVLSFHGAIVFGASSYYVKRYAPRYEREQQFREAYERGKGTQLPLNRLPQVRRLALQTGARRPLFDAIAADRGRILVFYGLELGDGFRDYGSTFEGVDALARFLRAGGWASRVLAPEGTLTQAWKRHAAVAAQSFAEYGRSAPTREFLVIDWASLTEGDQLTRLLARIEATGSRALFLGTPRHEAVASSWVLLLDQWFMMTFFFVSGASAWYALRRRTAWQYVAERVRRLLIPFVAGCALVCPFLVYFALLDRLDFRRSFFEFYPQFWSMAYFQWGHLWFVLYLFVFSLLALPLFLGLRREALQPSVARLATLIDKPGALFLLAIPLMIVEGALRPSWPNGNQNLVDDWANFFLYLLYFIYGYFLSSDEQFGRAIDRHWRTAAALGLFGTACIFGLWTTGNTPDYYYWPGCVLYQAFRGLNTWFLVLAVLGFARRYLNVHHPFLKYAGEAAYPVYIVHQAVLVGIAFAVVRWPLPSTLQYLAILLGTLTASLALYELLRRIPGARFLFGIKGGTQPPAGNASVNKPASNA